MIDNRITCTHCRELARNGACLAAREQRRLDVSKYYGPSQPYLPWRCEFFAPKPDAEDQRSGAERYPEMFAAYRTKLAEREEYFRHAATYGLGLAKAALANTS